MECLRFISFASPRILKITGEHKLVLSRWATVSAVSVLIQAGALHHSGEEMKA
jgi:hypothetical protein